MPDFSDYSEEDKAACAETVTRMKAVRAKVREESGRDMQAYDAYRITAVEAVAELLRLREMLREGVDKASEVASWIDCQDKHDAPCQGQILAYFLRAWLKKAQEAL